MITWRLKVFILRLFDYIMHIPHRVFRLLKWLLMITPLRGSHKVQRWFSGLILLVLDVTPVPLMFETILDWIKWKTRPLNNREKEIAMVVFGKNFPLSLIGIDPHSSLFIRQKPVAYVSFHTINFKSVITDTILVHEMVHLWQYMRFGAVYISEAFWAQKWGSGYDYGGLEPLLKYSDGLGLAAFNMEQQAEIIEEYYRWTKGIPLQWTVNVPGIGEVLTKYAVELKRRAESREHRAES